MTDWKHAAAKVEEEAAKCKRTQARMLLRVFAAHLRGEQEPGETLAEIADYITDPCHPIIIANWLEEQARILRRMT